MIQLQPHQIELLVALIDMELCTLGLTRERTEVGTEGVQVILEREREWLLIRRALTQ